MKRKCFVICGMRVSRYIWVGRERGRERVLPAETRIRNQVETVFPKIRTKGEEVFKEFDRKLV